MNEKVFDKKLGQIIKSQKRVSEISDYEITDLLKEAKTQKEAQQFRLEHAYRSAKETGQEMLDFIQETRSTLDYCQKVLEGNLLLMDEARERNALTPEELYKFRNSLFNAKETLRDEMRCIYPPFGDTQKIRWYLSETYIQLFNLLRS